MSQSANSKSLLALDSSFAKIKLGMLSTGEYNLFFAILKIISDEVPNKEGVIEANVSLKEVRSVLGLKRMEYKRIIASLDKLSNIRLHLYVDGEFTSSSLFTQYVMSENRKDVTIQVSPNLTKMIILNSEIESNVNRRYTLINLVDVAMISSVRSKELYRKFRQFRSSGFVVISSDSLLDYLFIEKDKYSDYKIIRDFIMPAIDDNREFFSNLKVNLKSGDRELPKVIRVTFDSLKKAEISDALTMFDDPNDPYVIELREHIRNNGGGRY